MCFEAHNYNQDIQVGILKHLFYQNLLLKDGLEMFGILHFLINMRKKNPIDYETFTSLVNVTLHFIYCTTFIFSVIFYSFMVYTIEVWLLSELQRFRNLEDKSFHWSNVQSQCNCCGL